MARHDRPILRTAKPTFTVVLALLLGLLLSEAGAGALRGFAFPYLNLFTPDARYGVRLLRDQTTRTRSRSGRVTAVRTNAQGFRGPDWSEEPGGILLLGDSQVFGYGVDERDALAAQLAAATGREVLNAAVPTWGPTEYALAAEELVPRFRPAHVVFVANVANDWVEARVPNTRRVTARDGWVHRARGERTAPASFPGRDLLLRRSQLVFLARELQVVLRDGGLPPNVSAELIAKLARQPARRDAEGFATPLASSLRTTREVCRAHACEVTAVALPLDVLVDEREWSKYRAQRAGRARPALSGARRLLTEFIEDARRLGVRTLNLEPVLRGVSPGAFLDDDYHLSPRGHAAIAAALGDTLTQGARHARK
jgi:hypothetical protein